MTTHRRRDGQLPTRFGFSFGRLLVLAFAITATRADAQETRKSYPANLITQEEIRERAVGAGTAYEVIRRLRPQFLKERSSGSIPNLTDTVRNAAAARHPIQVYVNGVRSAVGIAALRDIITETIVDITYLNASDATTRFGTGHNNGAILVKTG